MAGTAQNILASLAGAALLLPLAVADAHLPLAPVPGPVNICGWISNPTPANWWITDRVGEWTIGTQGGPQARGMNSIPDLTERNWVVTNGSSYGYGCGCMSATVDRKNMRIARIHSFKQKPIATCRADRKLPKP